MTEQCKFSFIANKMDVVDFTDTVVEVQCLMSEVADTFGLMHSILSDEDAHNHYRDLSAVLKLCQRGMQDVLRTEGAVLSQMNLMMRHASKEQIE